MRFRRDALYFADYLADYMTTPGDVTTRHFRAGPRQQPMILRHHVAGRSDWLHEENRVKQMKEILRRRHLHRHLNADHHPHPSRRTAPRHIFGQVSTIFTATSRLPPSQKVDPYRRSVVFLRRSHSSCCYCTEILIIVTDNVLIRSSMGLL